jgi:membrane-associated phospholipid phosphatase
VILTSLYDWGGLNRELFSAINGFRGPLIDPLMLAGTQLGDIWNAVWIASVMLILIAGRRALPRNAVISRLPDERIVSGTLLVFVVGCTITALLVFVGKTSFDMPRPYIALPTGSVTVLTVLKDPYSLPSGHSAFAMLVAWVFWPYCQRRWRVFLALCVVWVGVSRISVGAHFPADVLAGYICGGAGGWFATRVGTLRSTAPARETAQAGKFNR